MEIFSFDLFDLVIVKGSIAFDLFHIEYNYNDYHMLSLEWEKGNALYINYLFFFHKYIDLEKD